jgi:MOSC domain-containing protein YiiM
VALGAGRVESVNRSPGGVPKLPSASGTVTVAGLEGDVQRDLRFHGGPDRAVSLYSLDLIAALQADGHPIGPGTTGENLTVSGLEWARLVPGAILCVGDGVRLEVTKYAHPCANIQGSFADGRIERVSQKTRPGWSRVYARVLAPGPVTVGDRVLLEPSAAESRQADT